MNETLSGGCQCGRIRYTVEVEDHDAYLCHCRMCQRATGGVSIAFKTLPKARRHWVTEPEFYASSSFARRPFCRECGTPLGFEYGDSEKCDITVGSLDDPSLMLPSSNFGIETRHDAWSDTSHLPGHRCDEYPSLVERWASSGKPIPQ